MFNDSSTWVKKGNVLFDVTMGSYDGAEVCEMVGLYLLNKLSDLINKDHRGLYRDDGLAVVIDADGPKMDKLKKDIISILKDEGLSITIDTNLKETDFLDVSFNITSKIYRPYRKPGNDPLYINAKSNHPKSILKSIPDMINKRLNETSCNEQQFDNAKGQYEAALKSSGFKSNLSFQNSQQTKRKRSRKVIWFNPPYNVNVKTNIGKMFLKLVKKHFIKDHKYFKIFNTNTLKLSYSCTASMGNIITGHNAKVLRSKFVPDQRPCNCQNKANCPLNGDCLAKSIIYKAEVCHENTTETYYGQCEGEFKLRYNNHTKSFRHSKYRNETELSKLIWKLKDEGKEYHLRWSVASRATPRKSGSKVCDLCLTEKVIIVRAEPKGLLNKRTELISKCRHRNKFMLSSL